ncbi:MAG: anthranilate synthase component II [Flavobacteriales bacterium AspAUS03]
MKGKILVLDNYDSFTYNLVYAVKQLTKAPVEVFRNDEIALEAIDAYEKIILSPGPGIPNEAHILKPLIKTYAQTKSILGVCLGQQAIGEVFGAMLLNTQKVYHGVASLIEVTDPNETLFRGLPKKIEVGRYHSWIVSSEDFPTDLRITALGPQGEIMALRHKVYNVCGVQFHPESVLTPHGENIITNWLNLSVS